MTEAIFTITGCWLLASIILPSALGMFVAHYEDCTYEKDFGHQNLHWLYTTIRALAILPISYTVYSVASINIDGFGLWLFLGGLFFLVSMFLNWSLFYNGVQYEFRKKLSEGRVYKKGFFDEKQKGYGDDKNSANLNLSFTSRLLFFTIGTAAVIVIILQIVNP